MLKNPFRPSFGTSPTVFAGRTELLDEFQFALDEGPGSPSRTILISGQRGIGKTAALNELEGIAQQNGWITLRANPGASLLTDLETVKLPALLKTHLGTSTRRIVEGFGITSLGSIKTQVQELYPSQQNLESLLRLLLEQLRAHGTGVLISLDEVQAVDLQQFQPLAHAFQNCLRDDYDIAFVAAGLPIGIKNLLDHPGTTFLRRAQHIELHNLTLAEAQTALVATARPGKPFTSPAAAEAAQLSCGYPYLVQLIGYYSWREAVNRMQKANVLAIKPKVIQRLGTQIHQPALRGLSAMDLSYLRAMAVDDAAVATSTIATRLGKSVGYQSIYRQRLLDQELIVPSGHGHVDFALPYLREYLRTHPA